MPSLIYTNQRSKMSKKQRAVREALLKEQRAIQKRPSTTPKLAFTASIPAHRSTTAHIPSLDSGIGVATKRDAPVYTGTSMIGIGQMHKSNAVPVFKQQDAEDLAKMRR